MAKLYILLFISLKTFLTKIMIKLFMSYGRKENHMQNISKWEVSCNT